MTPTRPDSEDYQRKKRLYDQLLTIYGRKPVLEALQQPGILVHRLHLADSNRPAALLDEISTLARAKGAEICLHSKQALSRISRNGKQDQGVAVDLVLAGYQPHEVFLANMPVEFELIALDGVTNPQNLGMILRSVAASGSAGVLLPRQGGAQIDPLVIKASAGALFRCPIVRCDSLEQALAAFKARGVRLYSLSSHAETALGSLDKRGAKIFVLGNETHGVSESVERLCDSSVAIPMHNGVESLNVAVTASLLAFRTYLGSE
ncbi:MAG: RNA methyltransferase [Chromatiaceae bacterium]|nr:RNA methyltransferase [Chromatiaceae bacterium]